MFECNDLNTWAGLPVETTPRKYSIGVQFLENEFQEIFLWSVLAFFSNKNLNSFFNGNSFVSRPLFSISAPLHKTLLTLLLGSSM